MAGSRAVAASGAQEPAEVILKEFGPILEGYCVPSGFSGSFREVQFDFHKFLGHELFVTFASAMMQEDRWELLGGILRQGVFVNNAAQGEAPAS